MKDRPSPGPSRGTTRLGWLQKTPLVSLLFAVATAAVPFMLAEESPGVGARVGDTREEARAWFERNPELEVDSVGALILDPVWLGEALATAAESEAASASDARLPQRLLARSQAHLDGLIEDAYDARMIADPAWRLGVLDANTPRRNYVAHAFVHDAMPAVILCVAVLLLVGAPLERTWGSPVFTLFVLSAIPLSAQAYRMFDASSGVPWSGGTGLAAALLGAYFIRGLGGHFMLPGWILLPAWIATEAFVIRGFWIDDLGSVPAATLCAAVGFGVASASALRLMNVEARLDGVGGGRRRRGPSPVVVRAARMRSDGDPYQAFDLIQAAWRDDPSDVDVREAFFSIAVEVGQPEAAADAILPSLQAALRKGELSRAVDYWFPLAVKQVAVALEPTAFVRLGEALLDASHPEEALYSLRGAIDAGVSSAGAARIVNIARDLDPALTRAAAHIALADPAIEGSSRAEFERLVAAAMDAQPPTTSPAAREPAQSQLDRRVQAEHQTVETTAFPLDLDTDVDTPATTAAADDAHEAALVAQGLDGGALSAESLVGFSGDPVTTIMSPRSIKAIDAVPVGASDEWIEVDAEGHGKSKLPLARIDAIAMGAVDGLGPRPVLVIDFVLNWGGGTSEPIKSIRVRSDRFDPLAFAPAAANPLEALTHWVASIEAESAAALLPTRDILTGRFARFADLSAYVRDVLMAEG